VETGRRLVGRGGQEGPAALTGPLAGIRNGDPITAASTSAGCPERAGAPAAGYGAWGTSTWPSPCPRREA